MKVIRSWTGILAAWVLPILLNMNAVGLVTVETMMMFRFATSNFAFPYSPCIPGVSSACFCRMSCTTSLP